MHFWFSLFFGRLCFPRGVWWLIIGLIFINGLYMHKNYGMYMDGIVLNAYIGQCILSRQEESLENPLIQLCFLITFLIAPFSFSQTHKRGLPLQILAKDLHGTLLLKTIFISFYINIYIYMLIKSIFMKLYF